MTSKIISIFFTISFCAMFAGGLMAQNSADTTDGKFHDDLLDHFVGKWFATSIAHAAPFTSDFEVGWAMNHQYLQVHFKSREVVPWLKVPFEAQIFFGYNHVSKRYTVHAMTVHGDDGPYEGFGYAYRNGNAIKTISTFGIDSLIIQTFTWFPASKSWTIESRWEIAGKDGDPFLQINLIAANDSTGSRQKRPNNLLDKK